MQEVQHTENFLPLGYYKTSKLRERVFPPSPLKYLALNSETEKNLVKLYGDCHFPITTVSSY